MLLYDALSKTCLAVMVFEQPKFRKLVYYVLFPFSAA